MKRMSLCVLAALILVHVPAVGDEAEEGPPKESGTRLQLPEIVVVGERWRNLMDRPTLESPGLEPTMSRVTWAASQERGAYTVVDAMRYVPGAWVESRGRKVKEFFSVRGQRYPYPHYAVDGVWQREFHEMPYFFHSANLGRIDVLRSSSVLLNGPGGMTGIVSLVPRTHLARELALDLNYGMYNASNVHVNHGDVRGNVSYALGLGNRRTDGPRGENAAESVTDAYGRLAAQPVEALRLSLSVFGLDGRRELELADPPAQMRFQTDRSRYDPYRAFLGVGKVHYRASERISSELALSYALRDHRFSSDVAGSSGGHLSTKERDYEYGGHLLQTLKLTSRNVLRVGGLYNHWVAPQGKRFYAAYLDNKGNRRPGRRADLETYSLVLADEHRIDDLLLSVGYRWSRTYINEYGGFSIDGSPSGLRSVASARNAWEHPLHHVGLGAGYYITDRLSLHLNVAAGGIEPRTGTVDERGELPGRETRYKVDFGCQALWAGRGEASAVLFYTLQDDAIVLSGGTVQVGSNVFEEYTNRDQDQVGLELEMRSAPFSGAQSFLNAVVMRSRKERDGERIRNVEIPQVILSAGIALRRGAWDVSTSAKYVSAYESTRFLPNGDPPAALGDFADLRTSFGRAFGPEKCHRAYVQMTNLANTKYATVPGYPDNGRAVLAGLQLAFQ